MTAVRQFLSRIRTNGKKRPSSVRTVAMGRERVFEAFDIGDDTFILEKGVSHRLEERPSVLMVEKSNLRGKAKGWVMSMTTGNHSVAAFPLLDGRFWKLSCVPSAKRSDVLMRRILCANVVGGNLEISQRDIPTRLLVSCDDWLLRKVGFTMCDIVMGERNDSTLDYYRRRGQEWRVKPLAWTDGEMRMALAASRKRIASRLNYFHSMKGVHFLTFSELERFVTLARTEFDEFVKGIKELVSVYEGNHLSFTRMPKHRGHHEIELFGIVKGLAQDRIIPEIERLMEDIVLHRTGQLGVIQKTAEIIELYRSLLSKPDFADENSRAFCETLYMHITGEIYSVAGEGTTPAFDDRRTALPGATFENGVARFHPGVDARTEILLSNIRSILSKDENVEYANVYEVRSDEEDVRLGKGKTREIVYKTNRCPVERSLVEKRLARAAKGYGSYMLSRIEAFKSLGVALSDYRILRRRVQNDTRPIDFYIRRRCEGAPMEAIPKNYFCCVDDSTVEDKLVVLGIAMLMGDAAAQNLVMKKFDPNAVSPLYGIGKEIYEFEYDIIAQRVMPKRVSTCSIRGCLGWPCLDYTDENLHSLLAFYLQHYAHALKLFQKDHAVPMDEVALSFMDGFEFRTHALEWQFSVMRDNFESFDPELPRMYDFSQKWHFALWSLERQARRMPIIRKMFFEKVEVEENESLRDNS